MHLSLQTLSVLYLSLLLRTTLSQHVHNRRILNIPRRILLQELCIDLHISNIRIPPNRPARDQLRPHQAALFIMCTEVPKDKVNRLIRILHESKQHSSTFLRDPVRESTRCTCSDRIDEMRDIILRGKSLQALVPVYGRIGAGSQPEEIPVIAIRAGGWSAWSQLIR